MPDIDDELEEIKRLISDVTSEPRDVPGSSAEIDDKLGITQTRQASGLPAVRQPSEDPEQKQVSEPPAVRRLPGTPGQKQVSGLPAVRRQPGNPQSRQVTGLPAIRQKPGTPQTRQGSGPPVVRQKPGELQQEQKPVSPAPQRRIPPGQPGRAARPAITGEVGQVRSYDISSTGKVTRHEDIQPEPDMGSEEFRVNFDFEEAYKDVPENRPLRLRREKRTGCVGGILYAAFVICISLVLAAVLWMAAVDVLGFNTLDEQINITVQPDFEIDDLIELLYDSGLIKYKTLFSIYAGFSNAEDKITAGSYILNKNYDYRAIVQGMTARAGVRVETTVLIPEGFTMAQIFTLLEDSGVCDALALWEAATNHDFDFHFLDKETLGERLRLEGFLFPETYNFYLNSEPVPVINRLLREFNRRFTEEFVDRAEAMGYSIREIVNVAAMVEREAGSEEERPRIAAVIYNRLNNPGNYPRLEIDATIHYAIAGTGRPFSTELDHPYNTYMYPGLPPGPIANPGITAIRAALYPSSTNEYFYALNKEGTHNFFRTYNEHQRFVQSSEYGGRQ